MFDQVAQLLREAAARAILPRYRQLREEDVYEKSPGDVVTAADREAEQLIASRLLDLYPDTRVVGEEACAADPDLLKALEDGPVWLVDPIDGTANFVAGKPPFSVMVALLDGGVTVASWMFDPLADELCTAELGGGAWRNGEPVSVETLVPPLPQLRGAALSRFLPPQVSADIAARLEGVEILPHLFCAGAEYPAVAAGRRHFSLFWRTLPWDHAPGSLFLEEAGGHVCRFDGTPYAPTSRANGLVVAANPGIASAIREMLSA
jgi:fructose-1,6-bisphosphatase/inositol monophosphatase family enzyme